MLEDLQYEHPSKVFHGVRFVLLGFDPITKPKVSSKLLDGGGVDIGQYGPICTHVIVDKLIYDDPICVAARNDGKTLVNGLWVAHSFDVGMLVDPTSIMYRPLRDLKGIPGAKSLVVCLTGYQRQDRDDIMTMVDLMGANFSKPLVANKVTHLICYKFEGEKYELAKKMKKIKLVNHLWLEDCLKAWEILPEADYNKSGYELEELEAEAKDSEEETDIASKQFQLLNPKELQINQLDSNASRGFSNAVCTNDMVFATGKDRKFDQDPDLPEVHIQHPEVLDSRVARAFRNVNCVELVKLCDRTTVPAAVGNGLASTSGSERSQSDASKLSPKSYSRKTPRETTPTMYSGKMTENLNTAPTVNAGKLNVSCFDISSMTEQLKDGTDINLKIPKETVSHHEDQSSTLDEKQKMDVSCGSSKSQKAGQKLKAHVSAGLLEMNRSELLEPISLISDPTETNNCLSNNVAHYSSLTAALNSPQRYPATISKYQSSSVGGKSPTCCTPVLKTVNSVISQDCNLEKALQTSFVGSEKASLTSKPENKDFINRQEHATGEAPKISSRITKISSPRNKRLEIEKSNGSSNLSFHTGAHSTPPVSKMVSGKSWRKGKTNLNTNPKGSLYLNRSASEDDPAISSNLGGETASHKKLEMVSPEINLNTEMEAETYDVSQSRNKVQQKSMSMDDETEAPEEEENEVRETFREEKYGEVEPDIIEEDGTSKDMQTNKTTLGVHGHSTPSGEGTGTKQNKTTCGKRKLCESTRMPKAVKNISRGKRQPLSKIKKTTIPSEASEDKEENEVQEVVTEETYRGENVGAEDKSEAYKPDCNALGLDSHKTSGEDKDGPKQEKVTCGKRKLGESTHRDNEVRENINAGKKCSKIKKRLGPVLKLTNLKEAVNEEAESDKNEGSVPHLAGKIKRNESTTKLDKSMEVEKENRPIHTEDQNVSHGKKQVGKLASNKSSGKIDLEASKSNLDRVQVHRPPKPEPAWFILTAHKLQRKEFQQVIRRLKGKVCRDSHQWSYQATHFIVADPVRRTEKFFAAAASGRWILKTDYLIDSSQAGKFLAEEPYEWHKSGLNEDGAINLEAPRKWRLHRERTGHGAFYGMRIIIYGECIAPSLDTLKRVLKAGEGRIMATSPPYTRFLESGVDFAVVSPGMPRVDMWVQEFLGHEIPCVVADYLVEFVCKPGHSLERHVQYNTHALAEKALKNLVSQSEAIAGLMTPPSHGGDSDLPCHDIMTPPNDSDIPCQVCGSRDRGEEMLICGDESGSSGCGVGTHIDCCDPPLADVPEEDWFCPKCNKSSRSSKKPSKSAKKRTEVSKRK